MFDRAYHFLICNKIPKGIGLPAMSTKPFIQSKAEVTKAARPEDNMTKGETA